MKSSYEMRLNSNDSESYKRAVVAKAEANGHISQTARKLGISNKSLDAWMKHSTPLDMENASVKALSARVRQMERYLTLREEQY